MPEFLLRVRRFDPESGAPPYWDEHTIELEGHRSVLEGILQAKGRFDGSIGIRCSCQYGGAPDSGSKRRTRRRNSGISTSSLRAATA